MIDIETADELKVSIDLINIPVPPGDLKQAFDGRIIKSHLHNFGGVAGDDGVGRDVFDDDSACGDDSAVSDRDGAFDQAAVAEPNVVADNDISFYRNIIEAEGFFPALLKDRKRVGADGVELVVAGHDETGFCSDCAELSDYKLDFGKIVVVEHVVLFKFLGAVSLPIEIGIVANNDVFGFHKVL